MRPIDRIRARERRRKRRAARAQREAALCCERTLPGGSTLTTVLRGDTVEEIVSAPAGTVGHGPVVEVSTRPATDEERERYSIERTYYAADAVPRSDANRVIGIRPENEGIRIGPDVQPVVVEGCVVRSQRGSLGRRGWRARLTDAVKKLFHGFLEAPVVQPNEHLERGPGRAVEGKARGRFE